MAVWTLTRPAGTFSGQADTNLATTTVALANTSDGLFAATITDVSIAAEAGAVDVSPGGGNDDYGLNVRIMSGATVLAAATSGGAYETVQAVADSSTYPKDFPAMSFAWVNASASAAQWDAAVIEYQQTWVKAQGSDGDFITVAAGTNDITVTYTQLLPNATISLPTQTSITQTTATVGCTTDRTDATLYWYVSTSATPPSSANLKSGSGATDFGSTASPSVGTNTFSATGLDYGITYYTHFVHDNGSDSNILTSSSWDTLPGQASVSATDSYTDTASIAGEVKNQINTIALTDNYTDTASLTLTSENVIDQISLTEPTFVDTATIVLSANIERSLSVDATDNYTDTASITGEIQISGAIAATDAGGTDSASILGEVENVIQAITLTEDPSSDTFSAVGGQFMYSYFINMPETFEGYFVNL